MNTSEYDGMSSPESWTHEKIVGHGFGLQRLSTGNHFRKLVVHSGQQHRPTLFPAPNIKIGSRVSSPWRIYIPLFSMPSISRSPNMDTGYQRRQESAEYRLGRNNCHSMPAKEGLPHQMLQQRPVPVYTSEISRIDDTSDSVIPLTPVTSNNR